MTIKEFYKEIGGSYQDAIARFESEDLLKDFLRIFKTEKTFYKLEKAVEDNSIHDAFLAAHTLKGIASNLSLNKLYHDSHALVESLRPQTSIPVFVFEMVKKDFHKVIDTLSLVEL